MSQRLSAEAAEMLKVAVDQQVESAKKTFGLSQYAQMWLAGMDMPDTKDSKPTKPYKQVALVFTCIEKLIRAIAGLPPVLSTVDEKIVESGPVYDLLFNNRSMSWEKLVTEAIGHYSLSRDVFFVFPEKQGSKPKEIIVVAGAQMRPLTSTGTAAGELLAWEFRGTGGQRIRFDTEEVYQWKNFNPYDKFHGLGPLDAGKLNIDYSYSAALYNAAALANGAEPGVILTTPGKLDDDQIRSIRSQFDSRHKGASQAKRTALLTGGLEAKTVAMKMTDMQTAKIMDLSDKKICSAFGVPPGVAGLVTEAQYSHGPAQEDFMFNTIMPLAELFAGAITSGVISRFYPSESRGVELASSKFYQGSKYLPLAKRSAYRSACNKAAASQNKVFLWLDSSQHPTVQRVLREIAEHVLKFTDAGIPVNDIIEAHDLPYQLTDWGKHHWVGMGQVPASFILDAGTEGITGPSLPEGEGEEGKASTAQPAEQTTKADEQQRLRLWRNWVVSWAGIEREYRDVMRQFFVRQQRILTAKLKQALSELKDQKADTDQVIARVVFDLRVEDGKIRVINQAFFEKASELGIRQSLSEILNLRGEPLNTAVEQAKRMPFVKGKRVISTHKIAGINRTTQEMIARQLRQGLDAGEGLNDLTSRIKTALGSNRARALRIARTQTAGAVGTGRHAGMKQAGVELKAWITSGDTEVRDSHITAGVKYASGIPIEQPFEVDGELLMYPGDPAGSAANIINCRCLDVARRAAGKTFDNSYYSNLKFYLYSDMQCSQVKNEGQKNED